MGLRKRREGLWTADYNLEGGIVGPDTVNLYKRLGTKQLVNGTRSDTPLLADGVPEQLGMA